MYSGMVIWNRYLLELFSIFFVNLLIQMISQDSEKLQAKWVIHYEVLKISVFGQFLYDFVGNSPGLVIEKLNPKHSSNFRRKEKNQTKPELRSEMVGLAGFEPATKGL